MDEELLDSALDEFEDEKKSDSPEVKTESIQEVLEDIKNDICDEPGHMEEVEKMINSLASELENNQDLKDQIEEIGKNFFQEGVLKESMEELRGKLESYLNTHTDLPRDELTRYKMQLQLYTQICEKISSGAEEEAMDLVGKLSQYGELPNELLPPMPEECRVI